MPRHARRRRRYDYDYDYDDRYPRYRRRRRFTCLNVSLLLLAFLIVILLGVFLFALLAPYLTIIGQVLLGILAFLLVAGISWVVLFLYGMLQDQLRKKADREVIRVPKNERVVIRERTTRNFAYLEDPPALPSQATPRLVQQQFAQQGYLPTYPPDVPAPRPATIPLRASEAPPGEPQRSIIYFANIRGSIQPGQTLLGIHPESKTLRLGHWEESKTLLILGAMESGKTNDMLVKTCEAAQNGAWLVICDPHARKPDGLIKRAAPLASFLFPGTMLAVEHEDILHNVRAVGNELERRRQHGGNVRPLVLIVDEWNRLQRDETIARELTLIAQILGQEGRGFGIYGIFGAQQITYNVDLRKSVHTVIVHRVDESEAKLVIPPKHAKLAPELSPSLSFVKNADNITELLKQPLITSRDIEFTASTIPTHSYQAPPTRQTQPFNRQTHVLSDRTNRAVTEPMRTTENHRNRASNQRLVRLLDGPQTTSEPPQYTSGTRQTIPAHVRAEIIQLAKAGKSRRQIREDLGLRGAKYEIVRQVLDSAGL